MPASLAEVLADCIQPTQPQDRIVEYLHAFPGQRLRMHLAQLKQVAKEESLRLTIMDNTMWLLWGDDDNSRGAMLVGTDVKNTLINADWIVKNNDHLFKRVWENNELRKQAIRNPNDPHLVRVEQLLLKYKELSMELDKVFTYPNNLWHDKEAIQAAYGLRFDTLREYPF